MLFSCATALFFCAKKYIESKKYENEIKKIRKFIEDGNKEHVNTPKR